MHIYALSDMQVGKLHKDWPKLCIVSGNQNYSNYICKSNLACVISSRLSTTGREKQQQHLRLISKALHCVWILHRVWLALLLRVSPA